MTAGTAPSPASIAPRFVRVAVEAPRAPPTNRAGRLERLRAALFGSATSAALTLVFALVVGWAAWHFVQWALLDAVFTAGGDASVHCRAVEGVGACWPMLAEKWRLIVFGLYPYDAQWRPAVACLLMVAILAVSAVPRFWRRWLAIVWVVGAVAVAVFLWGGVAVLAFVPSDAWGGLPVTVLLATVGLASGFPLGVLLALARRSHAYPGIRAFAVAYIELVRAVPLVVVLYMASVMFPLLLPQDVTVAKLLRVQVAIALFAAAYLAEVIRGGMAAIPKGQDEAADAIGLGYWKKMGFVILPQALRIAIPGIVNTFISFFKATSIVVVVGIFDLLTAAKRALADPEWQGYGFEVYLFVGALYFAFCFSMSRYSHWLEGRLARGR
jgi:general L-amino acid transport system permease protein